MTAPRPSLVTGLRRLVRAAIRRPVGGVDWGDLRRTAPFSRAWGFDRGTPVDRYYIERFLAQHAADVRGRTLEVLDDTYARRYGGDRVTRADVLDIDASNPRATIVEDLARGDAIPGGAFDCIILTQTLHLVYDFHGAMRTLHRALRPGGVLLLTVPGITKVDRTPEYVGHWHWAFTIDSVRRLMDEHFAPTVPAVEVHGNVLAATAMLHGIAWEELTPAELDVHDPSYPVTIAVRAVKADA